MRVKTILFTVLPIFFMTIQCAAQMQDTEYTPSTPDQKIIGIKGPVKSLEYSFSPNIEYSSALPLCSPDATVFCLCEGTGYADGKETHAVKGNITYDESLNFTHHKYLAEGDSIQFAKAGTKKDYNLEANGHHLWLQRNDSCLITYMGNRFDFCEGWIFEDEHWWHYNGDKLVSYININHSDGYGETICSYSYDRNDNLQTVVVCTKGGQDMMPWSVSIVEYSDYIFDGHDNWTSRTAHATTQVTADPYLSEVKPESDYPREWTEYRTISYYPVQ